MSHLTRRQALLTGLTIATGVVVQFGGIASLLSAGPVQAAPGKPETTSVELGFIALTDAAPLIVAQEKGFFAKQGMTRTGRHAERDIVERPDSRERLGNVLEFDLHGGVVVSRSRPSLR